MKMKRSFVFVFPGSVNSSFDLSGSLLPQVYPQGDPAEYALPVFMIEPKDQYTAKGIPATLECKVAHAVKVCTLLIPTLLDFSNP